MRRVIIVEDCFYTRKAFVSTDSNRIESFVLTRPRWYASFLTRLWQLRVLLVFCYSHLLVYRHFDVQVHCKYTSPTTSATPTTLFAAILVGNHSSWPSIPGAVTLHSCKQPPASCELYFRLFVWNEKRQAKSLAIREEAIFCRKQSMHSPADSMLSGISKRKTGLWNISH